ncbi:protein SCAF11 isoform X4 [Danio aesculapii]|uniref:protein SCAF11 isoform X4 n=1 Tax=Danio aesculapii TaxID=1142201 RepID=UPI0024BFE317|nr:protein SCAF11 isoform X4 [Danio aesculapii]
MQEGPGKGGQNSEDSLEDEESQRCPICLNRPRRSDRAVPDCCRHVYCSACILRWAQMVQSCPVDRRPFSVIFLLGSSQQCIKLPVKIKPRLTDMHTGCGQDSQRMCGVSVTETGNVERTQEKRANPKQKCHRKPVDSDAFVDSNKKHFHSSQQGAMVGTLMAGSVEDCEDGVQWRRLERKRRLLQASVPSFSTSVPRVSVRSHLLLSAVSASLNLLLSEHTVPHGMVCAVTCPKGEERKGTRGSGSKSSVKPAEAPATRRSSRRSRGEAEDSSSAQSQQNDTENTSQTLNDTASTSRGQQGNNPRSGVKTRGRPRKLKVEKREDEEQEPEAENHKEDGAAESEESKTDPKTNSDQIDSEQDSVNTEEKMEEENETSPAETKPVDADDKDEETAEEEEVVTKNVVEEDYNQKLPQEDMRQEVKTDDEDQVELMDASPELNQDCSSPSRSLEPQESLSDSQDAVLSFQEQSTAESPTDASDQGLDLKPELDSTEDNPEKQDSSSFPDLQDIADPKPEPDTTEEDSHTQDSSNLPALQEIVDLIPEPDTTEEENQSPVLMVPEEISTPETRPSVPEEISAPETSPSVHGEISAPETSPSVPGEISAPETSPSVPGEISAPETTSPTVPGEISALETRLWVPGDGSASETKLSVPADSFAPETRPSGPGQGSAPETRVLVPGDIFAPETMDTNVRSPQDNTDLIPMECDSPASESAAEVEMVPAVIVPQMANQDPAEKIESSKESKTPDKKEGRSRRSRFHSSSTTWSPNRESRNERRSRSRSRDRSHKTRSTSRNRDHQEEERDSRRNRSRSRSRERSRRRRSRSRSRNRSRPGRRSPSQERADHGGHSPRKRDSWGGGGEGWRGRGGGRGFRNSNWRNNTEKPAHFSTRDPVSSDNGNFHESSPDRGRNENPDWVRERERERSWMDADNRGREPARREENLGDGDSWSRGGWSAGRGRGGTHWASSQQGESGDNWRQRNSFSGTANNADSYNRFNDSRAGGKRKESEGAETPLDRSGWSSASSWAVRRTLPADVQNYYSRRDRGSGGGGNNIWSKQEEDQSTPTVPKQADPPQNEPNAPLPTEAVPAMPPPLLPHQMGVMGVLRFPMGPAPLLQRPPTAGLQAPPQFSLPPPVPVQLHQTGPLMQVPSIAAQALPPPPPPPPPVQQGGFTVVPPESHPPQQAMPIFPAPVKMSFKPVPTKVVCGPPPPPAVPVSAVQPSSTTSSSSSTQPKAHADSSKKEKEKKLQIQERAVNEVKAAIKPYYQKNEINKDEYKEIVRKAVEKVCHSKSGEVNTDKVATLVKAYVDKYKHIRKSKTEKS